MTRVLVNRRGNRLELPHGRSVVQAVLCSLDSARMLQAIGLISEVYGCGWNAPPGADDQIMQLLLKLMSDDNLSRDTKPSILEAITCMLTTLQGRFMKYMGHVLPILGGAMSVR